MIQDARYDCSNEEGTHLLAASSGSDWSDQNWTIADLAPVLISEVHHGKKKDTSWRKYHDRYRLFRTLAS